MQITAYIPGNKQYSSHRCKQSYQLIITKHNIFSLKHEKCYIAEPIQPLQSVLNAN